MSKFTFLAAIIPIILPVRLITSNYLCRSDFLSILEFILASRIYLCMNFYYLIYFKKYDGKKYSSAMYTNLQKFHRIRLFISTFMPHGTGSISLSPSLSPFIFLCICPSIYLSFFSICLRCNEREVCWRCKKRHKYPSRIILQLMANISIKLQGNVRSFQVSVNQFNR